MSLIRKRQEKNLDIYKKSLQKDDISILKSAFGQQFSKRFEKIEDKISCSAFQNVARFNHETQNISNLTDLFFLLRDIKKYKSAFIIRGKINDDAPNVIFKVKNTSVDKPAYIKETSHFWQCLDIDHLHNANKLSDFDKIRDFIRSILPIHFQNLSMIFDFSSSMFLHNRDSISCHLFFFTDTALNEAQTKAFHKALNAYAHAQLKTRHGITWTGKIDPKVSECIQPIYTALPQFIGLQNPIKDSDRFSLVTKAQDLLDFQACWNAIEPTPAPRTPRQAQKAIKKAENVTQINAVLIGQPMDNLPKIERSKRTVVEIEKVLSHRCKFNRHYIAQKGIIQGKRDSYLTILLSYVAEALTIQQIKDGEFERLAVEYAEKYTSTEFAVEYINKGYYNTIRDRAYASANGEFVIFNGRKKDIRYSYSLVRAYEELDITDREIEKLSLRLIVSKELRNRFKVREFRGSKITKTGKIKTAKNSKIFEKFETGFLNDNQENISEFEKKCNPSIKKKRREGKVILKNQDLSTSAPLKYVQSWESRSKKLSQLVNLKKGFEVNFEFYVESYCIELNPGQRQRLLDFSRVDDTESTISNIRNQIIYMGKLEQLLTAIDLRNHLNPRLSDNATISKARDLVLDFLEKVNIKRQKLASSLEFETIKNEVYNLQLFDPYLAKKRIVEYLEESRLKYAKFQKCSMIVGSKATALKRVIILANRQLPVDHQQIETADLVPW